MSLAQIEAELDRLSAEELGRLALPSRSAFVKKTGGSAHECHEEDPALLAAVATADADQGPGRTAEEVCARLRQWTSNPMPSTP